MTRHWTKLLLLAALASSPALAQISSRATSLRGWNICNPIGAKTAGFVLLWDGTNNCWKSSAASGISGGISGLTTGTLPKAASASTLGDSAVSDNGTNVTSSEAVLAPIGSASLPGYAFTANTGSGMFFSGGTLAFSIAGVQQFDCTSARCSAPAWSTKGWNILQGNGATGGLGLGSGHLVTWASATSTATVTGDTGLARNAAGVVEVNNATAGTLRDLVARNLVGIVNYIATEGGAANAITGTLTGSTLTAGLQVNILLAHTLQAGANTFALNGGGAVAIKSHRNVANNIGTAYSANGIISLIYDGTQWEDLSQ